MLPILRGIRNINKHPSKYTETSSKNINTITQAFNLYKGSLLK